MSSRKDYRSKALWSDITEGPKPKTKAPTPPQMRFLHVLSHGILEVKSYPLTTYWMKAEGKLSLYDFHPTVANNVVMNGWAEMKSFAQGAAEYRISKAGRAALKELCEHEHLGEHSTESLSGNLICRKCARSLRCKSKQRTPHGANRWHWKYGPMCNKCLEFLYGE